MSDVVLFSDPNEKPETFTKLNHLLGLVYRFEARNFVVRMEAEREGFRVHIRVHIKWRGGIKGPDIDYKWWYADGDTWLECLTRILPMIEEFESTLPV